MKYDIITVFNISQMLETKNLTVFWYVITKYLMEITNIWDVGFSMITCNVLGNQLYSLEEI